MPGYTWEDYRSTYSPSYRKRLQSQKMGYPVSQRSYMRRKNRSRINSHPRAYRKRLSLVQELKFFDTSRNSVGVGSSGEIQNSLVLIPQGTGEKSRIGRKVIVKSLYARWTAVLPTASGLSAVTATGGDMLRIIFYIDKQCNGGNAAVLDILETATFTSFRNLANMARFIIISDKTIAINLQMAVSNQTSGTISTPDTLIKGSMYRKLLTPISFNSTFGVIAELDSNNLSVLYISKHGFVSIEDSIIRVRYDG